MTQSVDCFDLSYSYSLSEYYPSSLLPPPCYSSFEDRLETWSPPLFCMHNRSYSNNKYWVATIRVIIIATTITQSNAFDTGHHWDITYTALTMFNFAPKTIKNMQVMNWMTDFYSVSLVGKVSDFQLLHCDTLRNTSEVFIFYRFVNIFYYFKIIILFLFLFLFLNFN